MTAPTGSGGVLANRVIWVSPQVLRHVDDAFAIHGEHRSDWPFMASEPTTGEAIPFVPRATVEAMAEALRLSAEAIENVAKCVSPELAMLLRDRARPARAALARFHGDTL